jgi:hypothetical protein
MIVRHDVTLTQVFNGLQALLQGRYFRQGFAGVPLDINMTGTQTFYKLDKLQINITMC